MQAAGSCLIEHFGPDGLPGVVGIGLGRRKADSNAANGDNKLVVSAGIYARVLSLADQAPLECLVLPERTLSRATTLGYNHIGQVRQATFDRLVGDFGAEHAAELMRALQAFGLRQQGGNEAFAEVTE